MARHAVTALLKVTSVPILREYFLLISLIHPIGQRKQVEEIKLRYVPSVAALREELPGCDCQYCTVCSAGCLQYCNDCNTAVLQ